ncbi:hypothetical protein PMAYCL1PPCAC_29175 [Pristionchus mayeri]|uniref:Uncharacterized protein n=1 Tax=Pristionchus mayeri TaxID=1317129 RepID=A0AAN5ICD5_9BILA|nr:hypothetical protein PMAYCL1PPCAC_29175 [Pristionchus mayeri]
MNISIPDLRAQFDFPNVTLRAEAFSTLVTALKSSKDAKEKSDLLVLFWDCLFLYGDVVSRWTCASIEGLKKDGLLASDSEIILHCMRGLSNECRVNRKEIVRTILALSPDVLKSSLEVQTANGGVAGDVVDVLMERGMQQKELLAAGSILGMGEKWRDSLHPFMGRVEWNEESIQVMADVIEMDSLWRATAGKHQTISFIAHMPPSSVGVLDLSSECPIRLGSLLSSHPDLVLNQSLAPHPALLPGLLEICTVERDLARVPCGGASTHINNQAKKLLVLCQQRGGSIQKGEEREGREGRGLTSILQWLIADESRLKQWMERGSRVDFVPSMETICLLSALLPYSSKSCPESTMQLLVSIAQRSTGLANTIFLLCLTLLTRPWIEGIERGLVMETIAGTATHRSMVAPTLKILSAMCQFASDRMKAIDLIGDIVEKYPTSIGEKLSSLTSISESDDVEWAREKLRLIQRISIATDSSDAYLSQLTGLMKRGGPLLTPTIGVITELCRMDELDLSPVAAQLREKTKGGDDEATAAFVHLLAVAAKEKEDEELIAKFCSEISSFSIHRSTVVRTAAWKALALFPFQLVIQRTNEEDESTVMHQFLSRFKCDEAGEQEKKAFSEVLHALLREDVEQLAKPLYTTKRVREDDLLSSLLSILTPSLSSLDPMTTLCLFSPICYAQNVDKRVQYAISLFRTLLHSSIFPGEDQERGQERLRWMAGWRMATKTLLCLLERTFEENGAKTRAMARDRVNDELKRSLLSSSDTLPTVCMVLTAMIGLGQGEKDVSTFSSFFTQAVTFIQLANDSTFKPRVLPIFQVSISSCLRSHSLTNSLLSLISLSSPPQLAFFDQPIGRKDDIYWLHSENVPKELFDRLLGLSNERVSGITKVCDVRLAGVALGVDEISVEIVEDEIRSEEERDIGKMIEESNGEKEMETLFSVFCSLPISMQQEWRPRLKRRMERLAREPGDSLKVSLLRSLSSYSLLVSSFNSSLSQNLPPNYDYLPRGSLLRATVERILTSESVDQSIPLVESLVGIKRKDGRSLPPIDSSFLLPFEGASAHSVLTLVVQQKDTKQVSRLVSQWSERGTRRCSREEMEALGKAMGVVVEESTERIARKVAEKVVQAVELLLDASKEDESLLDFILPLMKWNIVFEAVISNVHPIERVSDVNQSILMKMMGEKDGELHSVNGRLGWLFEVLVEVNKCDIESLKRLLQILKGRGSMWRNGASAVIVFALSNRSADEVEEKMVHLINVANVKRSEGADWNESVSHLWDILALFIVAARSESLHFPLWIEETKEEPVGLRDLVRKAMDRYLRNVKASMSGQIASFATEYLQQLRDDVIISEFSRYSLLLFIRLLLKRDPSSKLQQLLVRNSNWKTICEM